MKIKDMLKRTIATNIKQARISANMTQAEAAEKLGVTAQAVSNFERGINGIENSLLVRMCEIYNTTMSFILGEEEEKKPALTSKDERDIARNLEKIMSDLENSGDLMFDGDPMSDEAKESIRSALKLGLEAAKLKNKEIYTPKKYRKG